MADFLPLDGILKGKDPETGNKVPLTARQDVDGNWHLSTIDGAPWGYNAVNDATKVISRSKKVVKYSPPPFDLTASPIHTITPPAGKIWTLKFLYFRVPAKTGGSTGSHQVVVKYSGMGFMRGLALPSIALVFDYGAFASNISTQVPPTVAEQRALVNSGIAITSDNPLVIQYEVLSSDGTPGSMTIMGVFIEEDIAL